MKVKEAIELLGYGTHFALIGAKTGKMLHNSTLNKKSHAEKYYECNTTDAPFYADFEASKDRIIKSNCDFIRPRICIWVSGE